LACQATWRESNFALKGICLLAYADYLLAFSHSLTHSHSLFLAFGIEIGVLCKTNLDKKAVKLKHEVVLTAAAAVVHFQLYLFRKPAFDFVQLASRYLEQILELAFERESLEINLNNLLITLLQLRQCFECHSANDSFAKLVSLTASSQWVEVSGI